MGYIYQENGLETDIVKVEEEVPEPPDTTGQKMFDMFGLIKRKAMSEDVIMQVDSLSPMSPSCLFLPLSPSLLSSLPPPLSLSIPFSLSGGYSPYWYSQR
jgi:hypothetical protein